MVEHDYGRENCAEAVVGRHSQAAHTHQVRSASGRFLAFQLKREPAAASRSPLHGRVPMSLMNLQLMNFFGLAHCEFVIAVRR
jgi:hypothetical protein